MKTGGHNFHPSRVSERAKLEKKRAYDKLQETRKKPKTKNYDSVQELFKNEL